MSSRITLTDSSLRDGNHSARHKISTTTIERYCKFAESAGIPIVEVGHGNGLGASSLLIGESLTSDIDMLRSARSQLRTSKLAVQVIPGLATRDRDLAVAIECGVDIFRVASHCTEASVTKSYMDFLTERGKVVQGVLMMTALADTTTLVENAVFMQSCGASSVIIMDSTGTYLPDDVTERVRALCSALSVDVGFHAHNNLGCAVANSIAAIQAGAVYIDVCINGFGAGAGNAPLEVVVPVFHRLGFRTGVDFEKVIKEADESKTYLVTRTPTIEPLHVLTGMHKLFSGFEKPIREAADLNNISYHDVIFALGDRQVVAGQEDVILEVARKIADAIKEKSRKEVHS